MTRRSEPPTPSRSLPTVRLEHLWFALALTIVGSFIALAPTTPRDFWWHLKAGELVATTGIPTTNLFAWSLPADTPYTYQSWLGEWLFFILYRVGGLPLTVFTRNMLGLIAFALVGMAARQRSGSWRLAAGAVLLAFAMTINNLTTRPQNWSWVPFTLTLVVCGSYAEGTLRPRWLLVLPLLMLFWVNVHGGFVMGLLVVGAFVVGESVRRWLRQPRALTWERIRALALASGGMLIATLANPLGPGVYSYVYKLLTDAPSQTLVKEWQPPTPHTLAGACFYLGVLALLAAFAFARRKPSITDVLLVCGLAWQAFVGTRYVVWFGMAAMPIAAQSLVAARPLLHSAGESHTTPRISRRERGGGSVANSAVVVVLALSVALVQPWFKPVLPLPQPYQAIFAPVPGAPLLFSSDTPVGAAEYLHQEPCSGRLFNEMGYGSYLDWALSPPGQVFIDPRVELYPMRIWNDYIALSNGTDAARLLEHYDIRCVVLDRVYQPGLAGVLPTMQGWLRTYADERSEVWRREGAGE